MLFDQLPLFKIDPGHGNGLMMAEAEAEAAPDVGNRYAPLQLQLLLGVNQ